PAHARGPSHRRGRADARAGPRGRSHQAPCRPRAVRVPGDLHVHDPDALRALGASNRSGHYLDAMTPVNGEGGPGVGHPALVVVDDDDSTRTRVANGLRRRFGLDYEVVECDPQGAHARLAGMRDARTDVALIVANAHLKAGAGTDFLATTRDVYPTARRLVLADFGDNWIMPSVARASTLGQVDHFDYLPWGEADEHFLAAVGDILADWATETGQGEARM